MAQWHAQADERAAFVWPQELDRAAEQLRALPHRHQAESPPGCVRLDSLPVIFDVELQYALRRT